MQRKRIKRIVSAWLLLLVLLLAPLPAWSQVGGGELPEEFDVEDQLDALGKNELMEQVPQGARELMEETGTYELTIENLLQLSPRQFFYALWQMVVRQAKLPAQTLGVIVGVLLLCGLLGGAQSAGNWNNSLSQVFGTVSVLCIITSVAAPIIGCINAVSNAIRDASVFMLSFIPVFSASLAAAGQPITGASYNVFLFTTCQVVAQVVAQTLVPLMGIYLALCICGSLAPDINIQSATASIKSVVAWALGLILTIFVGLMSVQTMVSQGADSLATKTTKFLIGSFVPVVGSALSEAYVAAQGCLKLIKTSLGAYGLVVAIFTFVPILLQTAMWYLTANLAAMAGELIGVPRVPAILRACSSVLGVLIAVILCYALLIVASITVVLVMGSSGM